MGYQFRNALLHWFGQVRGIVGREFSNLEPQEYTLGLLFCLAVGWILLTGRRM